MAEPRTPIDFAGLAAALLDRAPVLVPLWLPGGTVRNGEYVCASLSGGEGRSCSVNLRTGQWADFAGDDKGNDLISLYAAIHGLNQGQAALRLMADLGWQTQQHQQDAAPSRSWGAPQASAPGGGGGGGDDEPPPWADAPLPDDAGAAAAAGPGERTCVS